MTRSFVFIICLALCAASDSRCNDPTSEEFIEKHGQHESPRFFGRSFFIAIFICYMAADFLKTLCNVIEIYEDDLIFYQTSRPADHPRNEYETSDDSDGEHQYSFVEFLSKHGISFPAVGQ
ncbi:hypothetical protein T4C_8093 [Trichinella pseudospiralis]|uniref:Uncharacterized protein n=1 Tax=Trichinella pseudospiralis TaxID=6337 RepID=A0A0V1JLY3_TRIPS|nr:hypothetical protein T4C_8093 [Trichinella pseudospiralis]